MQKDGGQLPQSCRPARVFRRDDAAVAVAGVALSVLRYLSRPRVPDDYDALGFVAAVDDFDLRRFQPQAPGYPVYVALTRVAHLVLPSALDACVLVSVLAASVTSFALWLVASRRWNARAGAVAFALSAIGWLPWLLGTSALSDATACAFGALAFAGAIVTDGAPRTTRGSVGSRHLPPLAHPDTCACRGQPTGALCRTGAFFLCGGSMGAMLGVRLSYAPIAAAWAIFVWRLGRTGPARLASAAGLVVGTVAWLVPLIVVVGPTFPALVRTHAQGHFSLWGATALTEFSTPARVASLLRDTFFDGFVPSRAAVALGLSALLAGEGARWVGRSKQAYPPCFPERAAYRAYVLALAFLLAPYAVWIVLGQNIAGEPRHALPIVFAIALAVAPILAAPRLRFALGVCLTAAAVTTASLARMHRIELPAAAQAASFVGAEANANASARARALAEPGAEAGSAPIAVFGGRSLRMFPLLGASIPQVVTRERTWLSEVDVDLERFDTFPRKIIVTSEVEIDSARLHRIAPISPLFCRDARIDHSHACLQLFEYLPKALFP